ncbi:Asp-tRNA(Asn)/Glu-tRNA(Gln) amidotransferase subunit GatB [Candidatus Wolfebacteria bacterium]|nr:Asp-tRNA(Asn)/Glu-tRNA(Gln) amidotransferase subunit GatB [Candidatus Wolfebacteria bacterium]
MSKNYKLTIGLEVHAELKTNTKMFCDSKNDPDETESNKNVCPICMGHPGTLPVINKKAVEYVCRVGSALGGSIADFTEFDRKNYFYPDIPKGYQISQYKYPLVSGGRLDGVDVTRVHLEEDTARSSHRGEESYVDFNRAGIALMELVTEPVIHSAEQAGSFARELQLLIRTLGVSDANLDKGEMRIEANISISKTEEFGTKVEVKNLNSFRSVERAIAYEFIRQEKVLESGGTVDQETRGWDEGKQETFSQRIKEGAAEYRYFPEPDLPKLMLSEIPELNEKFLKDNLPELPWEKRERYQKLGIKEQDVLDLVASLERGVFFDEVIEYLKDEKKIQRAVNYLTSDIAGYYNEHSDLVEFEILTAKSFASLIEMVCAGKVSSRGAKDILQILLKEGGDPEKIAEEKSLFQVEDEGALKKVAIEIISENGNVVTEYKSGKEASLQFLIGQGMKKTKGAANPEALKKAILAEIR